MIWKIPVQAVPRPPSPPPPGAGAQFQLGGPSSPSSAEWPSLERTPGNLRHSLRERGQHHPPGWGHARLGGRQRGGHFYRPCMSAPGAPSPAPGQAHGQRTICRSFIQNRKYLKILFSGSNGDNPEKQETFDFFLFVWIFFSLSQTKGILLSIRSLANFHQAIKNKARRAVLGLGITALKTWCSLKIKTKKTHKHTEVRCFCLGGCKVKMRPREHRSCWTNVTAVSSATRQGGRNWSAPAGVSLPPDPSPPPGVRR